MLPKAKWGSVRLLLKRKAKDIGGGVTSIPPAMLARFDGGQLLLLARMTRARQKNTSGGVFPLSQIEIPNSTT